MSFGLSAAAIGGIAAGAGAIGGALISGSAAEDAAATQAGAADRASAAQERTFDKQVQLQEPWRQAGGLGLNALLYGLGLSRTGTFNPGAGTATPAAGATPTTAAAAIAAPGSTETEAQLRARLAPLYTIEPEGGYDNYWPGLQTVNRMRLDAAVQAALAQQQAPQAATPTTTTPAPNDPAYGALARDFSAADFQADPGYAFRLSEGEKALQRAKAASGALGSGGYLKDLTDYSQGMASQEFGNAFSRYQANRQTKLNALQSLAGVGQSSANALTGAAGQLGANIGSNIIGAGNAAAAGQVGAANALNGAIGQGISLYQTNQLLNRYPYPGTYSSGPGVIGDFPFIAQG